MKTSTLAFVAGLALIGLAFLLSGCSFLPQYTALKAVAEEGVDRAIADRQDFNDTKVEVLLALPCDASFGAVMRLEQRKQDILRELCGGQPANAQVTIDELVKLKQALDAP